MCLPNGFDYSLVDLDQRCTLAEWAELGVCSLASIGVVASVRVSLQLFVGHKGPVFLLLDNFRSIFKYNNFISYVLVIGLFVDNLLCPSEIQGQWFCGEWQLGRSERVEL